MNICPTDGRVIVKPIADEKLGKSNLYIPDAAKEKRIGQGDCLTGEYKGKYVYYKQYVGEEIEEDGIKYEIVDEEDILAYLEK